MAKYKCPKCEQIFEGPASFCPYCGTKVVMPKTVTIKCPICGGTHIIKCEYHIGANRCFTLIPGARGSTVRYVCKDCGYLMEFFSQEDTQRLDDKYGKK